MAMAYFLPAGKENSQKQVLAYFERTAIGKPDSVFHFRPQRKIRHPDCSKSQFFKIFGFWENSLPACNLTDDRFVKMSQYYEQEQQELKERAYYLRQELSKAKEQSDNVMRFMRSVRKYTEITELTPELVREFVQKVVVYQAEKINGRRTQRIDLYFNGVGQILLPVKDKRETA